MGDILAHHGVKGMKWGVRKDAGHEGEQAKTKKIAKLDTKFEKNAGKLNTKIMLHNYAAQHMNVHELDRINNKAEYKGKDLNANPKLAAKYNLEVESTYVKHLREGAAKLGTNASGTKKYAIEANNSREGWHVATTDIAHDDAVYHVPIKRGPHGHIISLGDADESDAMEHSLEFQEFLTHHGVLGMKWGQRKGSSSSGSKSSAPTRASNDHVQAESHKSTLNKHGLKALSNHDLKQLNERMQLEQTYRNLNSQKPTKFETGHNQVKKILGVAKTINDIHNTLNGPVGKIAKTAAKNAVKGAAKTAEAAAE